MVSVQGRRETVEAQPTAEIDAALVKDESAVALDMDIRWQKDNGYPVLDTSGSAFYRSTDKMVQVKSLHT